MEKLARSKNTPGIDAAFDLLGRVAVDPESDERYPNETVLIPADSPDASELMSRAVAERKPIAIVFPDGSDVVWRPPAATGLVLLVAICLLWLADHIRRKRDRPTFVPREWVLSFTRRVQRAGTSSLHSSSTDPQPPAELACARRVLSEAEDSLQLVEAAALPVAHERARLLGSPPARMPCSGP